MGRRFTLVLLEQLVLWLLKAWSRFCKAKFSNWCNQIRRVPLFSYWNPRVIGQVSFSNCLPSSVLDNLLTFSQVVGMIMDGPEFSMCWLRLLIPLVYSRAVLSAPSQEVSPVLEPAHSPPLPPPPPPLVAVQNVALPISQLASFDLMLVLFQ